MPSVENIPLPWAIAASATNLRMSVIENGDCQVLVDTFWGNHCPGKEYRRVLIEFKDAAAVYYGMLRSDGDEGGREKMDWSSVFVQPRNDRELTMWLEETSAQWQSTGVCPDAHFYKVSGSQWPDDYGGEPDHYLLHAGDAFIEVLARSFTWTELETLPECPDPNTVYPPITIRVAPEE